MSAPLRVVFGGRIGRADVIETLSEMQGVALQAVDSLAGLADLAPSADVLVMQDPRGPDGEAIARALSRPDNAVRWVQIVTAGTAGLTSHPLPEGLLLTNQGGAVAPVVAEHALGLMIAANRRFDAFQNAKSDKRWQPQQDPAPRSLESLTLAIVGYGNIGRELAKRAKPFGMRIIAVNRKGEGDAFTDAAMPLSALGDAVAGADVVAVTMALTEQTRHLIDADLLARFKPGAVLVNVARGEVVDQAALIAALREGNLRAAALDVATPEPLPPESELWDAPNLILTPHVAGMGSPLTGKRIAAVVRDNILRFQRGEALLHQVSRS